jgi:acetyl esterase
MKKFGLILAVFCIASVLEAQDGAADVSFRKNDKYATPEPGTYLDPNAYRILMALDRVKGKDMDSDIPLRLINLVEPHMYKVIDTIVCYVEYDVPVRLYYPNRQTYEAPSPVILYVHGGGFIKGSVEAYDMAVKKLARKTNSIIVSVDYRLAPEHPFPAALNDSYAVLEWLYEHKKEIGGSEGRICVMGDSAGGNLATVLALKCRDEGKDYIACQVLYYPTTTFVETEYPSRLYFLRDSARSYLLSEDFVRRAKEDYLGGFGNEKHPYLSPLEANLDGELPPALIMTAECDPLRDEGRHYAELLHDMGHEVIYLEFEGMIHGFFNFYMFFEESRESMDLVKSFISQHAPTP